MIEKLEKLIVTFTRTLELVNAAFEQEAAKKGGNPAPAASPTPPASEKKPRKTKAAATSPAQEPKKEPESKSPFDPIPGNNDEPAEPAEPEKPAAAVSVEDQIESKRRCQELMGQFIRRYLKATPSGLDRAKAILRETCGRQIAKLEELTHEDNVKLIPRFERELEAADAALTR